MNRIRQLRETKAMSQAELGVIVGKSLHAVSKWENGHNQPSQEDAVAMCRFFGVDMEYLLGVSNTPVVDRGNKTDDYKEPKELLNDIQSLFSGGELPAEDRDEFFRLVTEMYWDAKENRKNS